MPDPISPLGASGQIPSLNPTPLPSSAMAAEGGSVRPSDAADQVAAILGLSEAARRASARSAAVAEKQASSDRPISLLEAEKQFQEYLENLPSNLKFIRDEASGYVIFKVVNPVTQEVIRQFPPEELVKMARYLKSHLQGEKAGIFLDRNL